MTTDKHGKPLESAEDAAKAWFEFLINKFKTTSTEIQRPEMASIPSFRGVNAPLTRVEFDRVVVKMFNFKAVGPDGIPAEAIKY